MSPIALRSTRPLCLAIGVALFACGAPAQAEKADRTKPLNVEADAGRYDDQKQVGTFSGNVVMTKGTLVMRAGQIEVRQGPQGHQFGVATAAPGRLASFRQKREGLDEHIEGEAERIEYDGRADTVRFAGRAVIRRFRSGALADETSGNVITYDNTAEVFNVTGGPTAATPTNPTGRVRAVIAPRETPAPAQDAASAPALKSNNSLGERR